MACPYAKYIKGTIAYCTLVNKKVSTLRYPCKGNYRRCPIYVRYARARATQAPRPAPAPAPSELERAPSPAGAPVKVAREAESRVTTGRAARAGAPVGKVGGVFMPSEALCDSLVLASLIASASSVGVYRGPLRGVIGEANKYLSSDGFLFIVGRVKGYQFRALYSGGVMKYTFEEEGKPICGGEAEKLLNELGDEFLDAVIYLVNWASIPLWRDRIEAELRG